MSFPYEEKLRKMIAQLQEISNELGGMGLLGGLEGATSERLTFASMDASSLADDLEEIINPSEEDDDSEEED